MTPSATKHAISKDPLEYVAYKRMTDQKRQIIFHNGWIVGYKPLK